ncbi:MAG: hypothetical protein IJ012_01355 [Clostridia bacterium]|nr:hypothetical protein [Clostridia bacterium]
MIENKLLKSGMLKKALAVLSMALCLCAQIATILCFFFGIVQRSAEQFSFFVAVDYILNIFHTINISSVINMLVGVVYLVFFCLLIKNLLRGLYEALGFFIEKSNKNAPYGTYRNFGTTLFLTVLYLFLIIISGSATVNQMGQTVFTSLIFVYVFVCVALHVYGEKTPSAEYILLDVVRCGLSAFVLCKIFELLSSPALYTLIYNFITLGASLDLWDAFNNAEAKFEALRVLVLILYLLVATNIFPIVIGGYVMRIVYFIVEPFTAFGNIKNEYNNIKNSFKRIALIVLVWMASKCIILTYCTMGQDVPKFTWELVSEKWFEMVRSDMIPILLLSLAGYCLYSISYSAICYKEKKKTALPEEGEAATA